MAAWLGMLCAALLWRTTTGLPQHPGGETSFCDRDWHPFGEKCYRIFGLENSEKLSWDDATKKCGEHGGQLATIHSQGLQDYATVFLQLDAAVSVWIGLHDRADESTYEWQDRTRFNYTHWAEGEPSGHKDEKEDCVEMIFFSKFASAGDWNDVNCDWKLSYLCQVDRKTAATASDDPRFCAESGWRLHGSCFYVVRDARPWADAEAHCVQRYRGHLATLSDWTAEVFLEFVLRGQGEEAFWIGIRSGEVPLRWSSGWHVSPLRLTAASLPTDSCLSMLHGEHWEVDSCQRTLPFVCETSMTAAEGALLATPVILKPPPSEGFHCPEKPLDWFDLGGEYCYILEKKEVSWYEANFNCFRAGGSLISFHSQEEVAAIAQFLKYTSYVLHIGLYRPLDSENLFAWTDGSAVDFTFWDVALGEPNSRDENCTEMRSQSSLWNDIDCAAQRAYLCSALKIPPGPTIDERDGKDSCRHGLSGSEAVGLLLCAALVMALFGAVVYHFRRQEAGPDPKGISAAQRGQRYRSGEIIVREDADYDNPSY